MTNNSRLCPFATGRTECSRSVACQKSGVKRFNFHKCAIYRLGVKSVS